MPDLVDRPGTAQRIDGDWVVVRWSGSPGESRVPVGEVEVSDTQEIPPQLT